MNDKQRCSERVFGGSYGGHPCPRNAKVTRKGKPYCGQHDPEAVKARGDAREAIRERQWKDRNAAETKALRLRAAADAVLRAAVEWEKVGMLNSSENRLLRAAIVAYRKELDPAAVARQVGAEGAGT